MPVNIKDISYKVGINLEAKACKVLLIMYGISNENGYVNTSLNDLHQRSNLSKSTISSALKELQLKGLLKINPNVGQYTEYKLTFFE